MLWGIQINKNKVKMAATIGACKKGGGALTSILTLEYKHLRRCCVSARSSLLSLCAKWTGLWERKKWAHLGRGAANTLALNPDDAHRKEGSRGAPLRPTLALPCNLCQLRTSVSCCVWYFLTLGCWQPPLRGVLELARLSHPDSLSPSWALELEKLPAGA